MPLSLVAVSAASGGGIVMASPAHSLHSFANMDSPAYSASKKLLKMSASSGHAHGHRRSSQSIKLEPDMSVGGSSPRKSSGGNSTLPDKGQSHGESSNEQPGFDSFDPDKVMDWKDGIGTLPGSNMKVRNTGYYR
jgi:hypothetical protein